MRLALLAGLACSIALSGCDTATAEDQRLFEEVAQLGASDGITSDDWRVSPLYVGRAEVVDQDPVAPGVQGIAPNPAPRNGDRNVTVQIRSLFDAIGDLTLYRRPETGGIVIVDEQRGTNGPQFYTFTVQSREASPSTTAATVRLVVRDRIGRVVTYGDLELN